MAVYDLTLAHMRAIAAVAGFQGFSAAARNLMVSQSSLTRTIQDAERSVGSALFDRSTRVVNATPVCTELLGILRPFLRDLDDGLKRVDAFTRLQRGVVSIATLPSIAAVLLPPLLRQFGAQHPGIEFDIWDGPSSHVEDLLLSGTCQIAIGAHREDDGRFEFTPLWADDYFAVAAPPPPWAGASSIEWKRLLTMPFISTGLGTSIRQQVEAVAAELGIPVSARYGAETVATLGGMLRSGMGVAALPALEFRGYALVDLSIAPLENPTVSRRLGMLKAFGAMLPPAVSSFEQAVLAMVREIELPPGMRVIERKAAPPPHGP